MNRLVLLLILLPLAAHADTQADAALAAIRNLGTVNGQALACGQSEAAARAKALMLERAPRTFAYGDAFQSSTHAAFLAQTQQTPTTCPDAAELLQRLDALAQRLAKLLPSPEEKAR